MVKKNIIIDIKNIIQKYGETTSTYLKLKIKDKPTLIGKFNERRHVFIEYYNKDSVTAITNYNLNHYGSFNESNVISYENLPEPILNQILTLLKHYEKRKVRNKYLSIL